MKKDKERRSEYEKHKREHKTKGVGLMRSGKGLDIVTIMGAEMIAYGEKLNLELQEVFVDRTPEDKIDRWAIKQVVKWLEQEEVKALLVRRLEDITSDAESLFHFLQLARQMGVSIHCMEMGSEVCCVGLDELPGA